MFPMQGNQPAGGPLYVDDVFSAYTYTGNGSTQTITNGIDLAGEGGMVWTKARSTTSNHFLTNTTRGNTKRLYTDQTASEGTSSAVITSFNSDGFGVGSAYAAGVTYASWTFRNAPNFYHHDVVVKSAGSNATYNFSMHTAGLGMVRVKRTDSTGSWYVWHRSLTAGKLLIGETTAAEATLGHITVSGTTVTLVNGVIADGTYLVEAWAHDTSAGGIIQCGSFTTNGSYEAIVDTVGWEPQFLTTKPTSATGNWRINDNMRSFAAKPANNSVLYANDSSAEVTSGTDTPLATGFREYNLNATTTHIYLAIRRPNKPPTVGTEVYNAIASAGANVPITGVGFPPDLMIETSRSAVTDRANIDRLRGGVYCSPNTTGAEASTGGLVLGQDGANTHFLWSGTVVDHFFRRAPGFFDQICTTGTGANKTEAHNLAAVPELWLHKGRSGATQWVWGSSLLANTQKIVMPSPAGVVTDATAWNSTYPTDSVISFGTAAAVNTSAATYVTYLWATLAGVSKVFTYTGDGGSGKVIDCGFAAGARFVMIIRTTASTAQDIFIWDTVRGIVAGNDPHLSLNSTAAEVTTDDSIDPDSSGFAVNQVAATNINVNGAVYIGLAIA